MKNYSFQILLFLLKKCIFEAFKSSLTKYWNEVLNNIEIVKT